MDILPIQKDISEYLKKRNLEKKFIKQLSLLRANISYPSLEVELLEPKSLKIWSFRVDKKYRVIFIFRETQVIEVLDVNNHYK